MNQGGRLDILFVSARFNLTEPKEYFINDCCFGDDAALWLTRALAERGVRVTEPDQEDWGWYFDAALHDQKYFVGVGGNTEDEPATTNRGEWRLIVEKRGSLLDRLKRRNALEPNDAFVALLQQIIAESADCEFVGVE